MKFLFTDYDYVEINKRIYKNASEVIDNHKKDHRIQFIYYI